VIKLGTDASDAAAKALGWKTIRVDPAGDPAKMASGMNSLVNSKVDAIVLTAIEPAVAQAGLRAAKKAGIPVIVTLALVHNSPLFAGTYWPSPPAENKLLIDRMKKEVPRGSKVGAIQLPQFLNAKIAGDLFKASAKAQGWQIAASHDADLQNLVPDVKKAVGDMIRANPDIKAVWGCCDFAFAGSVPAIAASGKKIKLFSIHGVPSSLQFVKTGAAVAEIADYQKGSLIAMDALAAFFAKNTPIPKTTPKQFSFQMKIVDKSNAGAGYPYPTSKLLAQFRARWSKLYDKAG
jgi:ABC-type sugar transport system substrate-binding protein